MEWYVKQGCDCVFAVCNPARCFPSLCGNAYPWPDARRACKWPSSGGCVGTYLRPAGGSVGGNPCHLGNRGSRCGAGHKPSGSRRGKRCGMDAKCAAFAGCAADVTFGMYECPYPYKRLLTKKTMTWMVESGRFCLSERHLLSGRSDSGKVARHSGTHAQRGRTYGAI